MTSPVREVRARGPEGVALATTLLQRARRADPYAGVWEASDIQWWTRLPRASDDLSQLFWIDDAGPVAGVYLTSWPAGSWECDLLAVPAAGGPRLDERWSRATELLDSCAAGAAVELPVADDDEPLRTLAERAGLTASDVSWTAWLETADRPDVHPLPDGLALLDRTQRPDAPHPMRQRNGDDVAARLARCTLYDPALDLSVETTDGEVAGYALFWNDPTTSVGEVEPVRVEEEFQRLGLARAMVSAGVDRLAARGAARVVIGYGSEAAGTLYRSLGFRPSSRATTYVAQSWPPPRRR
jgi:predicted N-acetyltransferase YhbS